MENTNLSLTWPAFRNTLAQPGNVIPIDSRPRVLHAAFVRQLAEANRAVRQLRKLGCRVLSQKVVADGAEILVDRNPHRTLIGCPSVHVTCGRPA